MATMMRGLCLAAGLALATAECPTGDALLGDHSFGGKKLTFKGVTPKITYKYGAPGVAPSVKVIAAKGVSVTDGSTELSFMAYECAAAPGPAPVVDAPAADAPAAAAPAPTTESAAAPLFGFGLAALASPRSALMLGALALASGLPGAQAGSHGGASCDAMVEAEVTVPATKMAMQHAAYAVMKEGPFSDCPAETMYWEHPKDVYGGYKGCVGENGLTPCSQSGFGGDSAALTQKKPYEWKDGKCVSTGETMETQHFWILWGHPMDKVELLKRTESTPTVVFPLQRMPYPSMGPWGGHGDDAAAFRSVAKQFQVYLGAFTESELADWEVLASEGAESGMIALWAAAALEVAMTTCNRVVYFLMEAPCYGYSDSHSEELANKHMSQFAKTAGGMNCSDMDDPMPLSIKKLAHMPGYDLSTLTVESPHGIFSPLNATVLAPIVESMVFPENPTGIIKTPVLANPYRRVCDGVYLYPMYFGHPSVGDYKIPMEKRPDCSMWSFSITKLYGAGVRAGNVMYTTKAGDAVAYAIKGVMKELTTTMAHGLYSEWSWMGQIQIMEQVMEKPVDDPKGFIGAYSQLMKEKWMALEAAVTDDCPVELTNAHMGAYAWFKFKEDYKGGYNAAADWFKHVLNVATTGYTWGFRGADPSFTYGAGYTTGDFTRMQLYRDINVYKEVARRFTVVCAGGKVEGGITTAEWKVAAEEAMADSRRALAEAEAPAKAPRALLASRRGVLEEGGAIELKYGKAHADRHRALLEAKRQENLKIASCAPLYSTDCLFDQLGVRADDKYNDFTGELVA